SSKVMASRSSQPNQDAPRQPSMRSDAGRGLGSMNIDDILRSIYSDSESLALDSGAGSSAGNRNKAMEEVWQEIGNESIDGGPPITLENYLARAGAVNEEDVRVSAAAGTMPSPAAAAAAFRMDSAAIVHGSEFPEVPFAAAPCMQNALAVGGFGVEFAVSGGGRGKRRSSMAELALDKVTQQKQRRMIKNRESAARSRQRKQAYTVQLESQVAQLEEDNARLLEEEAEWNRKRYEQLMEKVIPVVERGRAGKRVIPIRRVRSMEW
ncbi:hypothetical protein M569_11189, partial [Genlisea aurea]